MDIGYFRMPYSNQMFANDFSQEYYDHDLMKKNRSSAIAAAKAATKWGIILGKPNQYVLSCLNP